ncbi:MAG: hypothetical protein R3B40_26105 [Polyangiales bacterium]|nr:hypothetical protein [Myxococcales bacterium]MCB9662354.1 hypothetical protein [Sandaracinaceae bacterium]
MPLPKTKAIDVQYFPLIVLTLPATLDVGYADILEHDTRAIFTLRERYVSITDSSAVSGMPDATVRKRMGDWAKSHEDNFRRWQTANALVVRSSIVRAGISAIHWLAPPPVPTVVETDWAPALAFLRKHAEAQGLDTNPLAVFERRQSRTVAS